MENLLPTALSYLGRGYSVIPVGQDKRPLVIWKEFQSRRATAEELVKWFEEYPNTQIGIVTGEISDLTVVDIESDGDLTLLKDETYTVKTGGGGIHVYFKYDKDFKNAVKILPSVDVRSEGGYVIASGSVSTKGAYTEIKGGDVMHMSTQTKTLLSEAIFASRRQLSDSTPAVTGGGLYPRVSTDGIEYAGAGEGSRNDSMTKFAGMIHAKLHSSLWSSIGLKIFEEGNLKNSPPLGQRELGMIWESISSRETSQNPEGRIYHQKERTWGPDNRDMNTVSEPAAESASGIKPAPGDSEAESSELVDPKETLHVSEVAASQIIDSDHTYSIGMKPFDEALLGGFSAGDIIVVAGQSGTGKTTLIQDWSVTLASGGEAKAEKLPTLWFSYEVLAKPLWQKFQGMGADEDTPIYMPRFNESYDLEWVGDVIEKAIEKWGIKVVAIDHLGFLRAPKGNYSNAADAITNTVRALKRLAINHGLIIMLPVHVRKTAFKTPDLNDIRDSLGIAQEADTVFFIGREKDSAGLLTSNAKLWLVKNRKTGISVSAQFHFAFGRYYYSEGESKKEPDDDSFSDAEIKAYNDF